MKKKEGITLVALIITIVVLLILTMVSINLVINSGIINKTKVIVNKYSQEEMQEQLKLAALTCYMNGNYDNVQDYLTYGTVEDLDVDTFKYCTAEKDYLVTLENGQVSLRDSTGIKAIDYVEIGDFVNYNAGTWTETKGNPGPVEFGNYTAGNNRGQSVVDNTQSGWRVLYKNEDGSIALVHAGLPEKFNLFYTTKYGVLRNNATQILSGQNVSGIVEEYNHTPRDWSNYIDRKYIKEAHCLNWNDIKKWYGDNNVGPYDFQTDDDVINIGERYYAIDCNNVVHAITPQGKYDYTNGYSIRGIRPVVILRKGVELSSEEKGTDIFGNEAWILN